MISFLKATAFVLSSYLILTFLNMGLVIVFYYEDPASNFILPLLIQAIVLLSAGFLVYFKMSEWFGLKSYKWTLYFLTFIFGFVSSLNLYLDLSIEPGWFVISNFIFISSGLMLGFKRGNFRAINLGEHDKESFRGTD